jgi:hypothetical protein
MGNINNKTNAIIKIQNELKDDIIKKITYDIIFYSVISSIITASILIIIVYMLTNNINYLKNKIKYIGFIIIDMINSIIIYGILARGILFYFDNDL